MNVTEQQTPPNDVMEKEITNRRAIDAVDTSIDKRFMAVFFIVISLEERGKHINDVA